MSTKAHTGSFRFYIVPALFGLTLSIGAKAAIASNYALDQIPQVVPAADAARLKAAGVTTTFALLEKAAEPKDRKALSKDTKISEKTLETWAQFADLLRIRGVGPDVARLLTAVGTKTVALLKDADPSKLNDDIMRVNTKQRLSENPPSMEHLTAWIAQAKTLPIVLK